MSDIIKTQHSLAIKAKHNLDHQFDHLYRLICREESIRTAIKAVLSHQGARTAGIDGMTKKTLATETAQAELVRELQAKLKSKQFRPVPVRRVYIPKANGKQRPLGIPTLKDRQLCWAHLKREFIKISERPGVCKELGTRLVQQQEKLFELWQRVSDGTLARGDFIELVKDIRRQIVSLLQQAADYEITSKEKTPLAKTVRTCRQLLKVEGAMWLFVTTPGVEPTNNAAL
ncbi:IS66 family transposase [Microseira wollei]|uniref:Transposase, unclassified family protein n=1 Tax=Microseira wollei NIES-4236 TaxID=2530354 RepID=A0AAV3XRC7_9CYAN|nr:transposase [Microseira wollei]GET43770.1 transposase, unclassified family protein [Microseira wollei NIES-4236]